MGECFFGSRSAFFFQKFQKKKKKKIITFPKRHADNFLEISPMVKTSYAFWSWICLWRFFDKIRKFTARKKKFRPEAEISAEGRNPCRRQGSFLISLKNPYCLEVLAVGSSIPPDGIDFFSQKKSCSI